MTKKQKNIEITSDAESVTSGLPIPFTIEEFHEDVAYLFLHQLRILSWMTGEHADWSIKGVSRSKLQNTIYEMHLTSVEAGLPYSKIEQSYFAGCLDAMYRYAYHGIIDESVVEPMQYETLFTWTACIVKDMAQSKAADEWSGFGGSVQETAEKLVKVIDLADARLILEDKTSFLGYVNEDAPSLTVRQVALLSGMEEMSVRSAANPRRAKPLPIHSEDRRAYILVDDAKDWLQSKGCYVPVTRQYGRGDIDLTKRRFATFVDLSATLIARMQFMASRSQNTEPVPKAFNWILNGSELAGPELFRTRFSDPKRVSELAKALEFPPELFALRVREVLAKEELKSIDYELRGLAEPNE